MRTRFLRFAPSKFPSRSHFRLLPVAALVLLLAACGDDGGSGEQAATSGSDRVESA